jgi:hypothetical protein
MKPEIPSDATDHGPAATGVTEQTMSLWKVNLIALALIPPVTILLAAPFIMLWGFEPLDITRFLMWEYLVLVVIPGVVLHELLHGAGWALFTANGFRSVRFGFKWQFLTPFCHCKVPLKVPKYAFGAGLPLLVLGLLPVAAAVVTGSGALMIFGLFFTWAAGGDMIALFQLARLDKNLLVSDHPEEMGFFIREDAGGTQENASGPR